MLPCRSITTQHCPMEVTLRIASRACPMSFAAISSVSRLASVVMRLPVHLSVTAVPASSSIDSTGPCWGTQRKVSVRAAPPDGSKLYSRSTNGTASPLIMTPEPSSVSVSM